MKFDQFLISSHDYSFTGTELISLYIFLVSQEDKLDRGQLSVLTGLRKILYNNFSIEEIESVNSLYKEYNKKYD